MSFDAEYEFDQLSGDAQLVVRIVLKAAYGSDSKPGVGQFLIFPDQPQAAWMVRSSKEISVLEVSNAAFMDAFGYLVLVSECPERDIYELASRLAALSQRQVVVLKALQEIPPDLRRDTWKSALWQ